MKRRIMGLFLAMTMVFSLAACGAKEEAPAAPGAPSSPSASAPAATEKREDLVIVMPEDLSTMDPLGNGTTITQNIHRTMYTRLYIDDDGGSMDPVPALAKEFTAVSDTEIQIKIHTGWKYSDGSEITVDDVVYCLNRAKASPVFATTMAAVESYSKVDDETLSIKTTGPAPSIKHALKHVGTSILPQAYVEKALADNDWSEPICSGPYKLAERAIGEYTKVVKNEHYSADVAVPQNNSLTFKFVPESTSRTIQVETGEADLNYQFGAADYARCMENPELKVYEKPGINTYYLGVDTTMAPFDDVRVRQALGYAINRDDVLFACVEGLGVPSYCVVPPTTHGYQENSAGYSYNVEKAKQLLAEAGYPNGFETRLLAFTNENKKIAEIVEMFLAEVGIKAEIDLYDSSVRAAMVADHDVPMLIASWGASPDADLVLPRLFTESAIGASNLTFYVNDEVQALLDQAHAIYDEDERNELYKQAVAIINEEAPWTPLFVKNAMGLARADLQGVVLSPETVRNFWTLHY